MGPPDQLPMPDTDSNRKELEEFIKEHYKTSLFNMCKRLREWCQTFNIAEEIATDGRPQMTSGLFVEGLKVWGVHNRMSSAYYPHSNSRAELAVKTGKRLLRDNLSNNGSLDNDRLMRAMMQYRNTPLSDLRLSPAQIVFNRQIREFMPVLPHKYRPRPVSSCTTTG